MVPLSRKSYSYPSRNRARKGDSLSNIPLLFSIDDWLPGSRYSNSDSNRDSGKVVTVMTMMVRAVPSCIMACPQQELRKLRVAEMTIKTSVQSVS